jgi:O-methyltransferase
MNNVFLAQYLGTPPKSNYIIDKIDGILRRFLPGVRLSSSWRGMASIEFRINIFHLINQILNLNIKGEVVEIGCNAGETTVVIQKIIQEIDPSRKLYAYDSFEGVPEPQKKDKKAYRKGDMKVNLEQFQKNFDILGLKKPIILKGWFEETLPKSLPNNIAFALIDADLYSSTLFALTQIYPKLNCGGICVFGVYWDPDANYSGTTKLNYQSPGVKKACDEFFKDKPEHIDILISGNYTSGYFTKL